MATITHTQGAHVPAEGQRCDDCVTLVADNGEHAAVAVRECPRHRKIARQRRAESIASNPEIAAVHAMLRARR